MPRKVSKSHSSTVREREEEEKKKRKRRQEQNAFIASSVMHEKELEENAVNEDMFAGVFEDGGLLPDEEKEQTLDISDEEIRQLEREENLAAEKKVSEMKLNEEDKHLEGVRVQLKTLSGRSEAELEAVKQDLVDMLAEVIAVRTISNSIKAYKVGSEDMGMKMTDEELAELTNELLTPERIKTYMENILERDDFKRMVENAVSDKSKGVMGLEGLLKTASEDDGKGLMDMLASARNELIEKQPAPKHEGRRQAIKEKVGHVKEKIHKHGGH